MSWPLSRPPWLLTQVYKCPRLNLQNADNQMENNSFAKCPKIGGINLLVLKYSRGSVTFVFMNGIGS